MTAADDKTLLRHTDSTYFHPGGICCIGSDNDTALDPDLQVRGVSELRVVDASAMPSPVAANTNATVPAVAERAASLIRGETS
ncbi:GMC oxidoreductase [Actinoplanes solisilvae]|uniref:GMC oxidoreductase n=1 Tax=Actinoplanes solisilvae TaxID=2486853 RepID=UPI001F0CD72B|nr:GMC oxidoreductase [Actinoplanes solisilvae]